jgi:4-hydroxy-3-methylbut-2-enyl diphosphate reductase
MYIEVDNKSGFCFGVVNAISKAEEATATVIKDNPGAGNTALVSLGDIVHNGVEVARLKALGLETVPEDTNLANLAGRTVLIRAHGEPPATYDKAREYGITLVDATCPVVAKLQKTVAKACAEMSMVDGQVVIFGKCGHAEVRGLTGQVNSHPCEGGVPSSKGEGEVVVIESDDDLEQIDFERPIYFLAQTTSSLSEFDRLGGKIKRRAEELSGKDSVTIHDTVCRQVSGREQHLAEFARRFDVVVFVAGAKSSNGRVLFEAVKAANPRSYKIESDVDLRSEWFTGIETVGVCGATSTPKWLMNRIAEKIERWDC